jgi:hypothetical protein
VHRGTPFLGDVLGAYGGGEVVFVDGEDEHGWACGKVRELAGRGLYFMRELPDGCPDEGGVD